MKIERPCPECLEGILLNFEEDYTFIKNDKHITVPKVKQFKCNYCGAIYIMMGLMTL